MEVEVSLSKIGMGTEASLYYFFRVTRNMVREDKLEE